MKSLQIELVSWTDAVSHDPWTDLDSAIETNPHEIHTVGFVLFEDKHKITIAQNIDLINQGVSCIMTIPKPWVTKRTTLKITKS